MPLWKQALYARHCAGHQGGLILPAGSWRGKVERNEVGGVSESKGGFPRELWEEHLPRRAALWKKECRASGMGTVAKGG